MTDEWRTAVRVELEHRFENWAAQKFRELLQGAGVDLQDIKSGLVTVEVGPRGGPVDGMHEVYARSKAGVVTVGRIPVLDFESAYRDIAEAFATEIEAIIRGTTEAQKHRKPGRPPGRLHNRAGLIRAYRDFRDAIGRQPTQQEFVDNLKPQIGVSTLDEYLTVYSLSWPIE